MAGTALVPEDVLVGTSRGPGLWLAPRGTALPTDTVTVLAAAYETVGFISDDMVSLASDISQEDLFVWQTVTPIRSIITERSLSFEFTIVETNPDTLALYFDTTKPSTGDWATGFEVPIPALPSGNVYAAVIDILDGEKALRFCFGAVTLSEAGEVEITRSGLLGYPVTLKVLADPNNKVLGGPGAAA